MFNYFEEFGYCGNRENVNACMCRPIYSMNFYSRDHNTLFYLVSLH